MGIKHKVLKDFQFVTNDKKIVILKAKTVLENYKYTTKNDSITMEKEVIDNNPDFFSPIDWKEELNTYIKQNKIPQPAILTKKLVPFIEEMFILNQSEPTIVEVEVPKIINQSTDLTSLEIELENKIKKTELREVKLREEQQFLNEKEIELNRLQSELDILNSKLKEMESKLNQESVVLDDRKKTLDEREAELNNKSENIRDYIHKDKFRQIIHNEYERRSQLGFYGNSEELDNIKRSFECL